MSRSMPFVLAVASLLAATPLSAQTTPQTDTTAKKPAATQPATKAAASTKFDVNTATKADLESLKGIGPVHAEAIIKGRPYKRKDELVDKKILTKELYDSIKSRLIAKQQKS